MYVVTARLFGEIHLGKQLVYAIPLKMIANAHY